MLHPVVLIAIAAPATLVLLALLHPVALVALLAVALLVAGAFA